MKRSDFNKMDQIEEKMMLADSASPGGYPVYVQVFHDKETKKYYQVQFANKGNNYRETPAYDNAGDMVTFGQWQTLDS
jgi:hypothetical protein